MPRKPLFLCFSNWTISISKNWTFYPSQFARIWWKDQEDFGEPMTNRNEEPTLSRDLAGHGDTDLGCAPEVLL
jgi:hypothetical protein